MIDKTLIESLLNKKHWAFTIFYNEIVDSFFSYLKTSYFLSNEEINDIIANTFVKIWNKLDSFDKNKWEFITWVWTILRNTTKDYFKKRKEKSFSDFEKNWKDWSKITVEETIEDDKNYIETLDWDYKFEQIKQAMEELKQDEKEILFLRFTENKSFREISSIIWESEVNVRVKTHRVIKKLKKQLKNM